MTSEYKDSCLEMFFFFSDLFVKSFCSTAWPPSQQWTEDVKKMWLIGVLNRPVHAWNETTCPQFSPLMCHLRRTSGRKKTRSYLKSIKNVKKKYNWISNKIFKTYFFILKNKLSCCRFTATSWHWFYFGPCHRSVRKFFKSHGRFE